MCPQLPEADPREDGEVSVVGQDGGQDFHYAVPLAAHQKMQQQVLLFPLLAVGRQISTSFWLHLATTWPSGTSPILWGALIRAFGKLGLNV